MVHVSAGTAHVLGLKKIKIDALPTTAYLMVGERCDRGCGFCPQSRQSLSPEGYLSRVSWPEFPLEKVRAGLQEAFRSGQLKQACLQVIYNGASHQKTREAVAALKRIEGLPINASLYLGTPEELKEVAGWGVDRISLPLDAASEAIYRRVKGGSFSRALGLLESAARVWPGHISTHLIVGLGETEEEMIRLIQRIHDLGVTIGLFAFTPVRGTPLQAQLPPPISNYRRVQAALHLIVNGWDRAEAMTFTSGRLKSFGLAPEEWWHLLAGGEAFRTSGCKDCNRPYYNERPGEVMYNYPRPLNQEEATACLVEMEMSSKTMANRA
ncbi:MAG: radical SAM protein [Firmicutes bacterium]|nr:radical SAM protein [Bacillota bacterium]MCL5039751.1 radical SAM protein [Bacillota bacterium]